MKFPTAIAFVIVAAATLVGGALHGHFHNRWGGSAASLEAAERICQLPARVGEWETYQTFHLSQREQDVLQSYRHVGRVYRHARSGEMVSLSIIVGPFGPTAAHTPEVCWTSGEVEAISGREKFRRSQSDDEFWTVVFRSTDVEQQKFRALYAWKCLGPWIAADHARFQFAASPYLCKMTLSCSSSDDEASLETCQQFLDALLPELASVTDAAK